MNNNDIIFAPLTIVVLMHCSLKKKNLPEKRSDIETPLELSKFITDIIMSVMTPKTILDPCSGNGNLTHFFENVDVLSFEIKKGSDFFDCKQVDCDLVVANPPFNGMGNNKLFPEEFLKHILKVVPQNTPIVLIAPHGLRLNVRRKSKRLDLLSKLNISSIITLPLNIFEGVCFATEVLIFNMPKLKPHYTFHKNTIIMKQPTYQESLLYKLNKCVVELDASYLGVTKTVANAFGLQAISGSLLAALIYQLDSNGRFSINAEIRDELSALIDTTEQVITNQIKALKDANLILREGRGRYFYNILDISDCHKIINKEYYKISSQFDYFKDDLSPRIQIYVE